MLIEILLLAMAPQYGQPQEDDPPFGADQVRAAGEVVGLNLTDGELELMLDQAQR